MSGLFPFGTIELFQKQNILTNSIHIDIIYLHQYRLDLQPKFVASQTNRVVSRVSSIKITSENIVTQRITWVISKFDSKRRINSQVCQFVDFLFESENV